jgi:hypothetical protein
MFRTPWEFAFDRHRSPPVSRGGPRVMAAWSQTHPVARCKSTGKPVCYSKTNAVRTLKMFAMRNEALGEFARTQRLGNSLRYACACYSDKYRKSTWSYRKHILFVSIFNLKCAIELPHLARKNRKLLDRLTNNPKGATFRDVRMVLIHHGFQLERITGSHHVFSRPDATVAIPVHETV